MHSLSSSLLGLAVCGGQSSRMGTDKGLLRCQDRSWAQVACDTLQSLHVPVYVSIHPSQQEVYLPFFPASQLLTDAVPFRGPLAAMLTAHRFAPHADWLVLACDLPDMKPDVLTVLTQSYTQNAAYEAFVYEKNGYWEPLCGLYTARILQKINDLFEQGQLPRHSMKYLLEQAHTYTIHLPENRAEVFQNYNTPTDLA